jgi:hypothetical protein
MFFFFYNCLSKLRFKKPYWAKKIEEEKNQIIQDPIVSNPIFKCQSGFVPCLNSTSRDLELAFFYFVNLRNLWEKKIADFSSIQLSQLVYVPFSFLTYLCFVMQTITIACHGMGSIWTSSYALARMFAAIARSLYPHCTTKQSINQ